MTALKWITTEAKKLKKKFPKKEWKDLVKQASAIYAAKHKGKSPVGKKKRKSVGDYSLNKTSFHETALPLNPRKKKAAKPKKYAVSRTASGTFRKGGFKRIAGTKTHKDTKSHNVRISVMSGLKVGNLPTYQDKEFAREIQLFADNDSALYFQRRQPILKNLHKKYVKGIFDVSKAAKLWKYYIEAADKKYTKEFGGARRGFNLSVHDRNLLAHDYAKNTLRAFQQGETEF